MPNLPPECVLAFHFLGTIPYELGQTLQRRLAYDVGERAVGRVDVLLCEHEELITVGCQGSRAHIRLDADELARRRLDVRWVSRGGGCVPHSPGQLAVYPIVPLDRFGWTARYYLNLLRQASLATLTELGIAAESAPNVSGVWGRTGQLAALGVSVRHGVATDGLFVNVNPTASAWNYVDLLPPASLPDGVKAAGSSLLAERRLPVRMTAVRAALVANLAAAFGCERYHLHTGHPLVEKLELANL